MDATRGGSTPPGLGLQPSTIYFPAAAADSTTTILSDAERTATCYSVSGALVAIAGIIRATNGPVLGDAIFSVAQTITQMARCGRCSDATAPASVRVAAIAPPGLDPVSRRSDVRHPSGPETAGHRGHGSPVDGRLCLDCDKLVRRPGRTLLRKINPMSSEYSPKWAPRVRCDPCRALRLAYYEGIRPSGRAATHLPARPLAGGGRGRRERRGWRGPARRRRRGRRE